IITGENTSSRFLSGFKTNMTVVGCCAGVIELSWLYGADQRAKIIPALIGAGLERWKIVSAKFAVFILLTLSDIVILGCAGFAAGKVCGISLEGIYAARFLKYLFIVYLTMLTSALPAVLTLCLTDKVIFMDGVYLLMMTNVFTSFANTAAEQTGMDLSFLDLHQQISRLASFIGGGAFNAMSALCILLYLGILLTACAAVFKKKELNF
ncbi:MAG: hypothetical protein HUJ54_15520, partial [Erysipelotrichaceae bacterium]|nr:hypothetical protein [Erysipelotrichaceae bacterium]